MKQIETADFLETAVLWYLAHHRQLPWRETRNPYWIWVSEIMLQQTQVETVKPYFERFITALPDVAALATVSDDQLLKLWEGLGYYSRARNLKRAAGIICADYGGSMPETVPELLKLPGIGPYTAGAVASIAFEIPVPAVDGNVLRVCARYYAQTADIAQARTRKLFEDILTPLYQQAVDILGLSPGDITQALMELGALVCTPKQPGCEACPLAETCRALAEGSVARLPVKSKLKEKQLEYAAVAAISYRDMHLLTRRPAGILADFWVPPTAMGETPEAAQSRLQEQLEEEYGLERAVVAQLTHQIPMAQARHVFTHRIWEMACYTLTLPEAFHVDYPLIRWVTDQELKTLALPTAYKKLLR